MLLVYRINQQPIYGLIFVLICSQTFKIMARPLIFLLLFLSVSMRSFSQTGNEALPKVIATAFRNADYNTLADFFNNKVDINIGNNEGVYGKAQAKEILKSFFEKHQPVTTFQSIHNGNSNENLFFSIGKLTAGKQSFRTYLLYQKNGNEIIIKEIRIEPEG